MPDQPAEPGRYTVGCVPYVNAIPLVMQFESFGDASPVRVLYDVPSKLPEMIDSGTAQAALVSSIDALRTPGRRIALGVGIGSHGPVKSVRLFSKVPPAEIRSLAHDSSSLTSNRLAQVILNDAYGARPDTEIHPPSLDEMLAVADACVLIGDVGMAADGTGLHVLDLGEEWRRLTDKPFLWAAWIGGEELTGELAAYLLGGSGVKYVGRRLDQVPRTLSGMEWSSVVEAEAEAVRQRLIERAMRHAHWDPKVIRDYFMNVMVYDLDEFMLDGLREFRTRLLANGFTDCGEFPGIVEPRLPE